MSLAVPLAAVLLATYVLVGALDLGVGMLLLLVPRGQDRDAILSAGGRPWSAGAVWALVSFALVVAGLPVSAAALWALGPPLVVMLLSLAFRAGSAALRPHVLRQDLIDLAFGLASLLATACQGLMLGWAVAGLGTGLPPRHTGPFGALSVWGLLCCATAVGLSALLGSGWLAWSGRDAVRVFGREVGRAAALLLAAAAASCGTWALLTGVAKHAFSAGWEQGALASLFEASIPALLVLFVLSLWGRRPALSFVYAVLAVLCSLFAFIALASADVRGTGLRLPAAYLTLVLLMGSPLVIDDLMRRALVFRRGKATVSNAELSHAGRRAGSLANSLHLS